MNEIARLQNELTSPDEIKAVAQQFLTTYYMGQALLPAPAGAGPDDPPPMLLFVAPRSEWEMLDDWGDMLGLKGSGSHSIRSTRPRTGG